MFTKSPETGFNINIFGKSGVISVDSYTFFYIDTAKRNRASGITSTGLLCSIILNNCIIQI